MQVGDGRRRRRMLAPFSTVVPDVTLQAEHGGARPRMKPSLLNLEGRWRVAGTGYCTGLCRRWGEVWLGHLWSSEGGLRFTQP